MREGGGRQGERSLLGTISKGVSKGVGGVGKFLSRQSSEKNADQSTVPEESPSPPKSPTLVRVSGTGPLSRSSQLTRSSISSHRNPHKSPRTSQVEESLQAQTSSSARLACHAETLNTALQAIFGKRPATFYELVAQINTFPKLEGMEVLGDALNEPNFQKRLIKDIPYLFDLNTRIVIENDKEKLEPDDPQLQTLNDIIAKLSEFASYFESINSELSNAIQKLLDYYQTKRDQICQDPSARSEILEQRGFVAGLSLKLTSVDIDTLCRASSITREGSFKKQNRFGGSLVSKLPVPNTDDFVFTKLGVVYGKEIEPLKYGRHCMNAAILEIGPMLPIRETTPLVVEAELLVSGIPVFNPNGEVVDFKTYNSQATLGIKGPEYHYTLAMTELSKKIKTQVGAEIFKSFYRDCLDYEPLIQQFCTTDKRRKLCAHQEIKTKNLTYLEEEELAKILRLLGNEFIEILGTNKFKPSEVNHALVGALEFLNYREILGAFAILEKYKEIIPAFSSEDLVSLLELVHVFQNAKRYRQLPKAEALGSLHDLPELKDIASLAAIIAYIRRDYDGKSDNWIGYICIDPPEGNQSRYVRRKQGHYINTKDVHYLVPNIMSRRFDPEVLKWFAAKHPALHMLQWMQVILERTLRLNQLFESQILQDSDLAKIRIPEDYIRQELGSRKRIREVCVEQLSRGSTTVTIQDLLRKVDPILMRFYELVAEQNKEKSIAETFRTGIYKGETVEQVFRKKYTDAYVRDVLIEGESSREPFYAELSQIQHPLSYSDELCKRLFDAIPEYEKNFNEETVDIFEAYKKLLGELDWESELTEDEQFQIIVALGNAFDLIQNQKSFSTPHHPFITHINRLSPEHSQKLLFQAVHMVNPNALKFLLKIGAALTHQDEEGRNALHILCERHGAYPEESPVLACMLYLLANPGVHEAFKQKKKDGATPLHRLVSCTPKGNEAYTEKLLEMVFCKFPNHLKNTELTDLCIMRKKPILFAWFVTRGVYPSDPQGANKFIEEHRDKQQIVDAGKLILNARGTNEFSLSHMINTAFSGGGEAGISLKSIEDTSIALNIRPELALTLSSSRVEESRQISSNGSSIQFLRIATPHKLQIRYFQDALEQACFAELGFPRKYLQLKNKKNDYIMLSTPPSGIPLTVASKEELSAVSSASLTKLFLLALIFDPEMDEASKYWLVKKENDKTASYSLVRAEPYEAIGLLSNKTKASYACELFNRSEFMNRELDSDVLLELTSSRKMSIFFSVFLKMKEAKGISFCLSEETFTRLNDLLIRLADAIKQKPYATALSLLQVFDPEKAKDVQYALSLSTDPLECTNLLKGRSNTRINTPKAETKKLMTELAEHIRDVVLDNDAVQDTIGLLNNRVNEGAENFVRLSVRHQSKILERIGFSVFNGSEELERRIFTVLQNPKNAGFLRIFIRYARHLKSIDIEKIIRTNGKTLTHLNLSGSEGVTDALMSVLPTYAPRLQALILNGTGVTRVEEHFYLPELKWLEIDKSEALKHVEMPFCEVETLIFSSKNLEFLAFYSPLLTKLQVTGHDKKTRKLPPQIAAAIETILLLSPNLMEFDVPSDITMLARQSRLGSIYRNRMKAVENWREKDELAPDAEFTEEELLRLLKHNELSISPASTIDIRDLNPKLLPSLFYALLDFKKVRSVHSRPYVWKLKKNNQGEEKRWSLPISANESNRIREITELPNGNVLLISSEAIPCIVTPTLGYHPLLNVTENYTTGTYVPNGLFYLAEKNDLLAFNGCGLIAKHNLFLSLDENITIIRGILATDGKPEILIGTSSGRLLSLRIDKTNNPEKLSLIRDELGSPGVTHIVFDGEHLFAAATHDTVTVYNRLTMKLTMKKTAEELGNNIKITSLQFIHHKLACGFENGRIAFYAKNDFSEIFSLAPPARNGASVTDIKPIDTYNFVSANEAGYVYIWNQINPTFFKCRRHFKLECEGTDRVFLSVQRNGDIHAFSKNTCNVFYSQSSYVKFDSLKAMAVDVISIYEQTPQYELVQYQDSNAHLQLRTTKTNPVFNIKLALDLATLSKAQAYQSREANGVVFEFLNPEICAAFSALCMNRFIIRQIRANNQLGDVFSINEADLYEEEKKEVGSETTSPLQRPRAQLASNATAASSPKLIRMPWVGERSAHTAAKSLPFSPKIGGQLSVSPSLSMGFHGARFMKSDQYRLLKIASLFAPKSGSVALDASTSPNRIPKLGKF